MDMVLYRQNSFQSSIKYLFAVIKLYFKNTIMSHCGIFGDIVGGEIIIRNWTPVFYMQNTGVQVGSR